MKNNSVERKVREIENTTGDSKGEIIKKNRKRGMGSEERNEYNR